MSTVVVRIVGKNFPPRIDCVDSHSQAWLGIRLRVSKRTFGQKSQFHKNLKEKLEGNEYFFSANNSHDDCRHSVFRKKNEKKS